MNQQRLEELIARVKDLNERVQRATETHRELVRERERIARRFSQTIAVSTVAIGILVWVLWT